MAHAVLEPSTHLNTRAARPSFLSALFAAFSSLATAMRCLRDYERLSSLSDEQLAKRGLKRNELVRHAFHDYLHT